MSIACLIQLRNEERFLPGFLKHVAPHVDGVVALDDCSTDSTRDILRREPKIASVLSENRLGMAHANEVSNRHRLILEAARLGARWVICADADERFEERFLRRLRRQADDADRRGQPVILIKLANLWDGPDRYRLDGRCGPRWTARMFRIPQTITRRRSGMHQPWFPPELDDAPRGYARALLYHLRMINRGDREARFAKFSAVDPERREQEIGYDHLTDETGLTLRPVLPFRRYVDVNEPIPSEPIAPGLALSGWRSDAAFRARFRIAAETVPNQATLPANALVAGFDFAALFSDVWSRQQ